MIKKIRLEDFKKVTVFETDIDKINVLIGANNSGKSSVLQGIHFSILAEAVRRNMQRDVVPQGNLLYQPAYDCALLRHETPYTNYSGSTSKLVLVSDSLSDGASPDEFSITISKGRNYGNISVKCQPNNSFRQLVTSYTDLYSVYVPGLSGIPLEEKLQTKAVIRRATASGDANLYLRNILFYINQNGDLTRLNELLSKIFPDTSITLPYDPEQDINIYVEVNANGRCLPLELSGTGLLQIVQILAYALLFKPKLFLMDEPDEHLHPNNQSLLVDTLTLLVDEIEAQVILCTHSRHMLSCLSDSAKIIWMKDGHVRASGDTIEMYDILLDIGALDVYDQIIDRQYRCVVLTEDKKKKMMEKLLEYNDFDMQETLIIPYKGCANIEAAIQLADFIHRNAPDCQVIIHRDRDFMNDEEVSRIEEKIEGQNTVPFVTDGSDIESYFISAKHLAHLLDIDEPTISDWLDDLARENHVEIQQKFSNKRRDIQFSFLYRDNRDNCPKTLDLFGRTIPTVPANRLGKFMLKKINGNMYETFQKCVDPQQNSPAIRVEKLAAIKRNL